MTMTEDDFFNHLYTLSLPQLSLNQEQLSKKNQQQLINRQHPAKILTPPGSIREMADNLGLDLTALMREVARR